MVSPLSHTAANAILTIYSLSPVGLTDACDTAQRAASVHPRKAVTLVAAENSTGEDLTPRRSGFTAVLAISGTPRLVVSAVVARIPQSMISVASLLMIHQHYGSFAIAGVVTGAISVGLALAAPVQGALVDRHGANRMLPPVAVCQCLACGAFVAGAQLKLPVVAVVALAAPCGVFVPPISATLRAAWMALIDDVPLRDSAFALDAVTTQLWFALGPLATAIVVQVASPAAAVLSSGLLTVVGTLVFVGAKPIKATWRRRAARGSAPSHHTGKRRWAAAVSDRGLRRVQLTALFAGVGGGSTEVGLSALGVHLGSRAISGVLLGVWALGAAAGGWYYAGRSWRADVYTRQRAAAAAVAGLSLPLIVAGSVSVALLLSLLAGSPWAVLFACQYRLVGDLAPTDAVTEAFTWNVAALLAGTALGSAIGGLLISRFGVSSSFVLVAVAAGLIVVWLGRSRRMAR